MRCLLITALSLAACDSPPAQVVSQTEARGTLTYAIGADIREISYDQVRCTSEDDVTLVELFSNRVIAGPQGAPQRPHVLIARLRGDEVLEAHAFAPQVVHDDIEYPMLHLVAREMEGNSAVCRVERGAQVELACNEVTVVPWLAPGPRPTPSFKVEFACDGG